MICNYSPCKQSCVFLYIGITLSVRPFCLVSATLLVRLNWVWTQLQCIKCAWRRIILVWTISRDITRGTVMYDGGYRLWFDSQFKLVLFNNHPYLCSSVKNNVNICTGWKMKLSIVYHISVFLYCIYSVMFSWYDYKTVGFPRLWVFKNHVW